MLQLGRSGSNGLLPGTLATPSSVVVDAGATLAFNRGSNKSFFDILSGGGGVLITNSNNAKVRLVSDNLYTGLTTIASGTLMIGQGNAGEPGSIVSDVLDNGTLDFNRVENITYGGAISGSGNLVKEAAGKLTLTAASTYSGGTTVSAGTLLAGNTTGSATGGGAVSVTSGATIGGSGNIAGTVTLTSGAHLTPGNTASGSIGTITLGGLSLTSNCALDYELGTPASSDLTIITTAGGLSLTGGGTLNITSLSGFDVGEYRLLDYTGTFTGSPSNLTIGQAPPGFVYSIIDNPATTSIDVVVSVPEPATGFPVTVLGALSYLGSARRRRAYRCSA
jgi:fibronectin-binding autotransporter adhesin